jgi:hypothetical protein
MHALVSHALRDDPNPERTSVFFANPRNFPKYANFSDALRFDIA